MAKQGFRVIDSEPHLQEPYDLWAKDLPAAFRNRFELIPPPQGHLELGFTSHERIGDKVVMRRGRDAEGRAPGDSFVRNQGLRRWTTTPHLAEIHSGYGTPELFLEGFDTEGIDIGVVMPTLGSHVLAYNDYDPPLALVLCQVYNNWAHEFTQAAPDRFKFWGEVPPHDAELAAEEARRCVESLGAVGITIASETGPSAGGARHFVNDDDLAPLWEELNRLQVPVGLHGFGRGGRGDHHHRTDWLTRFSGPHAQAVAGLIFGGVLDTYPNIKPVFMEAGANGVPAMLERMDDDWYTYGPDADFKLEMWPSEYYKSRCYTVTRDEGLLRFSIEYLGDDHLLFSTDYPHHDCAFPDAVKKFVEMDKVSDESKRKILWDNGAKLFGLA